MKKLIILLMAAPFFVVSCGPGEEERDPVKDSLTSVTQNQGGEIKSKDSTIESFLRSFNEIQDNLDMIKEKEKIISMSTKDSELEASQKDQIVADIQQIYELMAKNKQQLASMNGRLKKANVKMSELEKMIERITSQLGEKEAEVTDLKAQLEKMNLEVQNITMNYEEEKQESQAKTEKLNTAYYAFGTSKELIKQGVLTKEGGFIGIGKAEKLKDDFNRSYFTKIDLTQTTSITLGTKKAKLITSHPSGSYKLEGTENKVEKLTITNPEDFWSSSKYLVVVVD